MKRDAIFRIYSMTKPTVSVAVMQMVEEGKLQVSDPVARYLPEIGKMKVGTEKTVEGRRVLLLSDPERPMTVQDLLRHTSGLTYGTRGTDLVNQSYIDARIGDRSLSNQEMVSKLSTLALKFQPGARWEYGVSVDVLGRLVEVLDGKTLGEALTARVFQPLGMTDSAFQVSADKLSRVAQPGPRLNGQPMTPRFAVNDGAKYESGGGGLTSTIDDYLRFTAMLSNGPAPLRHGAALGLRPRLRGPQDSGRGGAARVGRRVWLGRQCRHGLLDRPQEGPHRHLYGAGERPRPCRPAQPVPDDGAGVDRWGLGQAGESHEP